MSGTKMDAGTNGRDGGQVDPVALIQKPATKAKRAKRSAPSEHSAQSAPSQQSAKSEQFAQLAPSEESEQFAQLAPSEESGQSALPAASPPPGKKSSIKKSAFKLSEADLARINSNKGLRALLQQRKIKLKDVLKQLTYQQELK